MQRGLRILSVALITAGITVGVDVGMTLAWKEPLSAIYGSIQQGKAEDSLEKLSEEFASLQEVRRLVRGQAEQEASGSGAERSVRRAVRKLAAIFEGQIETGQGIGRLEIPSIDVDIVVVQGTDTDSLRKGPGHYPETALPGQGRTIGIAGHRTTYLAPFRNINEVADGDQITLEMPYGTLTYSVEKHEVVEPTEVEIVDDVGYERLVLTACHPLYSAAQRWAVFARLADVALR